MSPKYIGKGLLVPVGDLTPEQVEWLNRRFEPHQHGGAGETMPASNRQARESEVWEVASLFDRSHWPNVKSVRGPESA